MADQQLRVKLYELSYVAAVTVIWRKYDQPLRGLGPRFQLGQVISDLILINCLRLDLGFEEDATARIGHFCVGYGETSLRLTAGAYLN